MRSGKSRTLLMGMAIALLFPLAANALPKDKDQPIQVTADSAERDEKTGITRYSGNVQIRQGSLLIEASEVIIKTAKSASGEQELEDLICTGSPVHFQQQVRNEGDYADATANTIHYHVPDRTVELNDNAILKQLSGTLSGEHIVYDIEAQRVQAKGPVDESAPHKRVTVIIPPKKKKTTPPPAPAPTPRQP